jgi:hypothetical protein
MAALKIEVFNHLFDVLIAEIKNELFPQRTIKPEEPKSTKVSELEQNVMPIKVDQETIKLRVDEKALTFKRHKP